MFQTHRSSKYDRISTSTPRDPESLSFPHRNVSFAHGGSDMFKDQRCLYWQAYHVNQTYIKPVLYVKRKGYTSEASHCVMFATSKVYGSSNLYTSSNDHFEHKCHLCPVPRRRLRLLKIYGSRHEHC